MGNEWKVAALVNLMRIERILVSSVCCIALMVGLWGCESSNSLEQTTDAFSATQATMLETLSAAQTDDQIKALHAFDNYTSSFAQAKNLKSLDALAFDVIMQAFGGDSRKGMYLRFKRGGFYVAADDVATLSASSQTDPSARPLFGVVLTVTEASPDFDGSDAGTSYIIDSSTGALVKVDDYAGFAIKSGFSKASDYQSAITKTDLKQLSGRSAADFSGAVWCTFKIKALDYDKINEALDSYWGTA